MMTEATRKEMDATKLRWGILLKRIIEVVERIVNLINSDKNY